MTLSFAAGVRLVDLAADPYPTYARLRVEEPVAWIPELGRFLVTRFDDVMFVERNPHLFSSVEEPSLMTRAIGNTLLRQDGEAHKRIRKAAEGPVRPKTIKDRWSFAFKANADELIDTFVASGSADLVTDFAGPLAARNLATILGLRNATASDMQRWSQAFIDGCGNYADDPEVWTRCETACRELDAAITEMLPSARCNDEPTVISSMADAAADLTDEEICTNIKIFIGGGINEPRDATAVAVYGLLANPDQRRSVTAGEVSWRKVFEEAVRWISPIGMYPRQVTATVQLGGTTLEPGDKLGVSIASANRDESVFADADVFDVHRESANHVAFGGGAHFCLGTWVARISIADIALPTMFSRLPELALADPDAVEMAGWVFRGPLTMPARWRSGHHA
ncbi:unspecific monooxygenase [Rhodococcus sp. 06-462-5]|uniref:cytochrome P450 n=1 Tax=unclassified Rhodococcus (in: high G+C Gram-positive bacteria) TaxID=192944 RepID=UPI000B9BD28F|nr:MULTISPECIES: cytochrome P450 [unclassified Rhodococcus (in: high G+C Gram-positive bacteria)]OZC73636.1 unspecific monooxygenase [Rhodococcus sp. 06-462-5]OZE63445.1 unspecific monooxygenase [Rhodococcus sp. 02-925g]